MHKPVYFTVIVFLCFLLLPFHASARQFHHHGFSHNQHSVNSENEDLSTVEYWVGQIRDATKKYHDINIAELEGFLPFGPDMPNMGEHFVNPALAVSRNFDPNKPSVLTYLNVNGNRILTGVAYTLPVQPGEMPPNLPLPGAEWHFHEGNLEEEAYGLHNHSMNLTESDKVRLGMVHAWVWMENPDGIFAADNWALNYHRLEITPSKKPDPDASKALFLLNEGIDYYTTFVKLAARPDEETLANIRSRMKLTKEKVSGIVAQMAPGEMIQPENEKKLSGLWPEMWTEIKEVTDSGTWGKIEHYLHHKHHH